MGRGPRVPQALVQLRAGQELRVVAESQEKCDCGFGAWTSQAFPGSPPPAAPLLGPSPNPA